MKKNFDILNGRNLNQWKNNLVHLIADKLQEYFTESFDKEGFNNIKWKEVQRRIPGTTAYKRASLAGRTNPILTKSSRLRKSIKIIQATWSRIEVGSVVPYAEYHNEGTAKLPKRQFIGETPELDNMIEKLIEKEMDKLFK